ncbi:MAG: hypothetical protein ACJ8LG_05565 [Massilia sp.]
MAPAASALAAQVCVIDTEIALQRAIGFALGHHITSISLCLSSQAAFHDRLRRPFFSSNI